MNPMAGVLIYAAAALFITQALVAAGDVEKKWIAPYTRYFEAATKQAVQIGLSLAFTGAFWLVLFLGAALFKLIGLTFLDDLIGHAWFGIPATTLAIAMAVHISDVRANIVDGIRGIALALLSWLLPLLAVMAAGFLVALVFTGLEPLWNTRSAASILLLSCAALVILLNAAFQDGDPARAVPLPMTLAGYVCGFVLLPFVGIAGYAIALRVAQYGWTGERIVATAVTLVALTLAAGYFAADILALRKHGWRLIVERTNIAAAILAVVAIVCLFTPIADPMRIAVNSQVARLERGAVAPEKLDFNWLRYGGGRFGRDALTRLAQSENAVIAGNAAKALRRRTQFPSLTVVAGDEIAQQVVVYPRGRTLPESLLNQDWGADGDKTGPRPVRFDGAVVPPCLYSRAFQCAAFYIELTGDTRDELLFVWGDEDDWNASVLGSAEDGSWSVIGTLDGPHCKAALEALRAGQFHPVAPIPSPLMSIDAAETRLDVRPVRPLQACPAN